MPDDQAYQRCLRLATQLNGEQGWALPAQSLQRYAAYIASHSPGIEAMSDTRACAILRYYHQEHALVEALLDPANPQHAARWEDWARQALRLLATKTAGARRSDADVVDIEDLTQEALQDLWRGLPHFSYQSSLQTWAFTVISNCLARHYRGLQTQKRGALPPPRSLDSLLASGDSLTDSSTPPPDDMASSRVLADLVHQVLRQHPDRRVATIFHMWANEEQTLRLIGDQLDLSTARVHALLRQAIDLLRSRQEIQHWGEQHRGDDIVA